MMRFIFWNVPVAPNTQLVPIMSNACCMPRTKLSENSALMFCDAEMRGSLAWPYSLSIETPVVGFCGSGVNPIGSPVVGLTPVYVPYTPAFVTGAAMDNATCSGSAEHLQGRIAVHVPAEADARRPLRRGLADVGLARRVVVGERVIADTEV